MDEVKVEIVCYDCNGDGFTVPYGPNGYEAQENCETCKGTKKVIVGAKFASYLLNGEETQ